MNKWKNRLAQIDDEYLVGLANKGIVKRAYKDREETAIEIVKLDEEVEIKVGGETVLIRYPLGESKCSCPSRSICRHIVLAILVLPDWMIQKEKVDAQNQIDAHKKTDIQNQTDRRREMVIQDQTDVQKEEMIQKREEMEEETSKVKLTGREQLLEEIRSYPFKSLKKTLGVRQFQNFIAQVKAGIRPQIQYSSIITVKLPQQEVTVKLLFPLEYSSCTCHKKEFCVHKASAVLWCQLEENIVTEESLVEEAIESLDYNREQIQKAAEQMKIFLDELLGTGLSRTSPDVLDYLERLAVISHNTNLPKYEGYFRALFDSYKKYFKRMASFQIRDLMGQITRLYRRVELLISAKDGMEIARYAGEFKAEYNPVKDLDLIGIAMEHFSSQTGYEGETVYFLEEHTKEWYTYTVVRPIFYESSRGRGKPEKGQAPWGTMVSLEELSRKRIHLSRAKCDERNRLSSSQETKGTVIGERKLTPKELEGWYYQDFGKLFMEQIGWGRGQWLQEEKNGKGKVRLVVLRVDSCEKAEFSKTDQRLSMVLFDKAGREVVVEVVYSKKEEYGIQYLEQIRENRLPYFLGKIYLKDGRIRMYPIALMDRREIRDEWI